MGGRVTSKGHAVGCTDQGIFELILWAAGWRVVVKGVYPRHFSSRIFSGDEALEHTLHEAQGEMIWQVCRHIVLYFTVKFSVVLLDNSPCVERL